MYKIFLKIVLVSISIGYWISNLQAQTTWSRRFDLLQGDDIGYHVIPYKNQYYFLSRGSCEGNAYSCRAIEKVNDAGVLIWKKFIPDTFSENYLRCMFIRHDTIYYNANKVTPGAPEYAVLMYDTSGNFLGKWPYSQTGLYGYQWARDISGFGDKIFVSAQYRTAQLTNRGFLLALDLQGNTLWRRDLPPPGNKLFGFCASAPTADGGVGFIYSTGNADARTAMIDRYNTQGVLQWRAQLPVMSESSNFVTLTGSPDGGFVGSWRMDSLVWPGGVIRDPDLMFKLDANGNFEWQKVDFSIAEYYGQSFVLPNGDIISAGQTFSIAQAYYKGRVRRMSPQGEVIWRRNISDLRDGSSNLAYFGSGSALPNGDMVFLGGIEDTTLIDNNLYTLNTWLVRLDSNGCFTPGCTDLEQTITVVQEPAKKHLDSTPFTAFPSPCTDHFYVATRLGTSMPDGRFLMQLYNNAGQLLLQQNFEPKYMQTIDIQDFAPGLLHLLILNNGVPIQGITVARN